MCEKGSAQIDPEKVKCFSKMEEAKVAPGIEVAAGFSELCEGLHAPHIRFVGSVSGVGEEEEMENDSLWGGEMDDLFQRVQQVLKSAPCVECSRFCRTILAMDTSQYGGGLQVNQQ